MPRRVLKDKSLLYVRNHYELDKWAKAMKTEQRRKYFELIDFVTEKITSLSGEEPSDQQMLQVLGCAVDNDGSMTDKVMQKQGSALADPKEWDKITQAAAGAVLQEYVNAVEKREWP